jgi:hypothetical protein
MLEVAFQRKRTPPMIVLYAIYLAGLAFSYRRVEAFLENPGVKRSYYWLWLANSRAAGRFCPWL